MPEKDAAVRLLDKIKEIDCGNVNIMEVCGTHTMSIAKSGIKSLLPENVKLISGPGCPVCVTPGEIIDQVLDLAENPDVMIATYGDMVRVPGTVRGQSLSVKVMKGANVEIVYSPIDALKLAKNSTKQVVFLGVGFETTSPGTAASIKLAKESGIKNFTVLSMLKRVEPALRALLADPMFNVQGFLCPGHVATIIGEEGFEFLTDEYKKPSVISGFEAEDILLSIYKILKQMETGNVQLQNEYTRAVRPEGNVLAQKIINEVFCQGDSLWRGLGIIFQSGLDIRPEFADFDAARRFGIDMAPEVKPTACRCGDVIQGKITPKECPLFGKVCDPENPAGPCMVSSEGSCAAFYKYM